jgi:solute carrier family 45 protein 1/2/4
LTGWFPFLFYSTTWVGETYFRYENPESAAQSTDTLGDVGRLGSLSLVIFSSITFLSSVLLPFGVRSPDNKKPNFTPRPPPGIAALLRKITTVRPDLQTAWFISHLMFSATMIFAPLAGSVRFATLLVSICGIPWAISGWAPFAFMGVEINKLAMEPPSNPRPTATMITSTSFLTHGYQPVDSVDRNADVEMDVLRLNHRNADDESDDESVADASSTGELAGIYLGVLNVYTTLPQFVGTFISWVVFSILEPAIPTPGDGNQPEASRDHGWMNLDAEGPNAIAVCLFIGALSALVAAEATRRFKAMR